jgi:hypothetical protein
MVKTLAQLQQVERLEPLEVKEPEQKKVYVIVTITYSYVPKSSRKSLNKKIKNE